MKRLVCGILMVATMMGCLCGCSLWEEETLEPKTGGAMVVIVGRHANARMYSKEMISNYVLSKIDDCTTITKQGSKYVADVNVSIIVSDGDPMVTEIMYRGKTISLHFERNNVSNLLNDLDDAKFYLEEFLMSDDLRADDPEVDLPAAISEASLILHNEPTDEKYMVILDTGIVTAGYVNMNELNIQKGTIDEVLDQLAEGAYPDLNGIQVSFYGIGNVGTGQNDAVCKDSVFRKRLVNFWTAYFSRCADICPLTNTLQFVNSNGVEMIHDEEAAAGEKNYPKVSNVPFVISQNTLEKDDTISDPGDDVITMNSLELDFKANSWQFNNEEKAREELRSYGQTFAYLKEQGEKIYVVGSIAKTKPTTNRTESEVSRKRAEAVKKLIVSEYGIAADLVVVIDGGSREFTWRDAKEFPDGTEASRDPAAMQKNRLVAIIPESLSEAVAELKDANLIN